jgi:tRNA dimethylallyltransferase
MAQRWHHNDWRKMRRSLQIFYTTGERHSDILKQQKESGGGSLRYRTGVFWLWADNKALDPRLDSRVDDMIRNGLFTEIQEMREKVRLGEVAGVVTNRNEEKPSNEGDTKVVHIDYTRGVMQSIGFKEFDTYLSLLEHRQPTGNEEEKQKEQSAKELEKAKDQGLESMKAGTRRYARRQVTWIRNKLGPKCIEAWKQGEGIGFWALDATGLLTLLHGRVFGLFFFNG